MLWSYNYGKKIYIPGFTKNKNIINYVKYLCGLKERIFPFSVNPFPENVNQQIYATTYYDYTHGKSEFQLVNNLGLGFHNIKLLDYIAAGFLRNGKLNVWYYRPNRNEKHLYLSSKKIDWNAVERKLSLFCIQDL